MSCLTTRSSVPPAPLGRNGSFLLFSRLPCVPASTHRIPPRSFAPMPRTPWWPRARRQSPPQLIVSYGADETALELTLGCRAARRSCWRAWTRIEELLLSLRRPEAADGGSVMHYLKGHTDFNKCPDSTVRDAVAQSPLLEELFDVALHCGGAIGFNNTHTYTTALSSTHQDDWGKGTDDTVGALMRMLVKPGGGCIEFRWVPLDSSAAQTEIYLYYLADGEALLMTAVAACEGACRGGG